MKPWLLSVLACMVCLESSAAQPTCETAAFETFSVELGAIVPIIEPLSEGWSERTGASAHVESPFYAGRIAVGGQLYALSARGDGVPPLRAGLMYLEWRTGLALPWRLEASAGPRVGLYVLHADAADVPPNERTEQEVALFAVGRLHGLLTERLGMHGGVAYGTVLFSTPVRQAHVQLGLTYTFDTPASLREVLR